MHDRQFERGQCRWALDGFIFSQLSHQLISICLLLHFRIISSLSNLTPNPPFPLIHPTSLPYLSVT